MAIINYLTIRTNKAEKIKNSIINTLEKHNIRAIGQVDYNGNAIAIYDKHERVFMWVRLIWKDNLESCLLQMSNIRFATNFQRKGIFTNVITNLKRHKYVSNIMIQSVSTKAMKKWCVDHNFVQLIGGNMDLDYYWKSEKT